MSEQQSTGGPSGRTGGGIAVAAWLVLAGVVGFVVSGRFLYDTFIGLAPSAFPLGEAIQSLAPGAPNAIGGLVWGVGLVLILTVASVFVLRRRIDAPSPGRRRFLTGAAALGTAAVSGGLAFGRAYFGWATGGPGWRPVANHISAAGVPKTAEDPDPGWEGSRIRDHRRLGRTEYRISDIVLGSGPISGEKGTEIARLAFERGVNYVDTSPDYSAHGSEEAVGRALRGRRNEIFVATKFCNAKGHLPPGTPVATYMEALEGSLRRLGTDHVDLVHIHSCDEVERLLDPGVHEAFDRLKEQGKVRFLGVSTHTPRLPEVANAAIDSGRFDVMMLAYHHGIWEALGGIIARARREQDMGIVAMKTLKGAKHDGLAGFKSPANAYSQAALKWTLSNPDVSCAVISFTKLQHCDEYLAASGRSLDASDVAVLEEYDRRILGSYCAPHCGACLDRCPEGLPIHDVLRHRMYFEDYGREKEAMRLYAQLGKDASVCASCTGPCLGSCPVGVPIPQRMREAHDLLTLS
jgi:aryl-alcohol dehydrogenase-like predicted oxidoreductase